MDIFINDLTEQEKKLLESDRRRLAYELDRKIESWREYMLLKAEGK